MAAHNCLDGDIEAAQHAIRFAGMLGDVSSVFWLLVWVYLCIY